MALRISKDPSASLSNSIIFSFHVQGYIYFLNSVMLKTWETEKIHEKKDQYEKVAAWDMTGAQAWGSQLRI